MNCAMIFPGQGSQEIGMGADLQEVYPEARQVFETADALLGFPLSRLCFEGPLNELTETHNAQPALLTHSVAVFRVLESRGLRPSVVAGHSLGEYSALVACGALGFEDALRIVRKRGELMFQSGLREPGTMAAVIGLEQEKIESICSAVEQHGVCDLANLNAPGQVVISGSVPAIEAALPLLQDAGAKMVRKLNVSGAFHSRLMQEPARTLSVFLDQFEIRDTDIPVIPNVTATPETDGDSLRDLLKQQIAAPVLWSRSMQTLSGLEPGIILEVGAGSVLRGLMRRIDRRVECESVGDRTQLESLLAKIATA